MYKSSPELHSLKNLGSARIALVVLSVTGEPLLHLPGSRIVRKPKQIGLPRVYSGLSVLVCVQLYTQTFLWENSSQELGVLGRDVIG